MMAVAGSDSGQIMQQFCNCLFHCHTLELVLDRRHCVPRLRQHAQRLGHLNVVEAAPVERLAALSQVAALLAAKILTTLFPFGS